MHKDPQDNADLITTSEAVEPRTMPLIGVAERPDIRLTTPVSIHNHVPVSEATGTPAPSEENQGSNIEQSTSSTAGGFGDVNQHTGGSEFYGPNGTFYFLSRLRSYAQSGPQSWHLQNTAVGVGDSSSVVNLLHSSDYTPPDTQDANLHGSDTRSPARPDIESSSANTSNTRVEESLSDMEIEIQRECVRLYFDNLHCIHPILDHASFLTRCDKEMWLRNKGQRGSTPTSNQGQQRRQKFLALFNIVLAIGATTAGDTSLLTWDHTTKFLERTGSDHVFSSPPPSYPPIRVARLYFERARTLLGDVFESSSLETTQALFLMVC